MRMQKIAQLRNVLLLLGVALFSAPAAAKKPAVADSAPVADSASVFNLLVGQSGMYRVTYEQLLDAGLDLNGASTSEIAVTNRGVSHPRQVEGKRGVFGPGGWIAFYAEELILPESLYAEENVYQIQVDERLAKNPRELNENPASEAAFYMARVEANDQNGYHSTSPNGDPWYDTYRIAYQGETPRDIDVVLTVDHLLTSEPATLQLGLWGITSFAGETPDHHVRILVNGVEVAEESGDGLAEISLEIPLAAGLLVEGDNAITIRVTGETAYARDAVALDRYALLYPRVFVATDSSLKFAANAPGFKVSGFASKTSLKAYAWEHGGELTQISRVVSAKENGAWSASFAGLSGVEATYWIGPQAAMLEPDIAPAVEISSDLMTPADLLIITHPFFKDRLLNPAGKPDFVKVREAEGYSVAVKDVFEIYAAFGHGIALPEAIKAYLEAMHQSSDSFRFALLVGGSTYDPLGLIGADAIDFIPTWYKLTGRTTYFTPTDVPYGDFLGNIIPEKMVARWPVRTIGELDTIIQKSLDWYANGMSSDPSALLVADQKDPAYPAFDLQMDRAALWLGTPDDIGNPTEWTDTTAVYLDDTIATTGDLTTAVTEARKALVNRINSGVSMTMMAGHGSYTAWTNVGLLRYQDVSLMTNTGKPTLITPLSCYTTYFPSDSTNTLGHHLLLEGDNGAVAIHGATAMSSLTQNEVTAEKIIHNFVQENMTLGESIIEAKKELSPGFDTVINWQLNGDPTLKRTTPETVSP